MKANIFLSCFSVVRMMPIMLRKDLEYSNSDKVIVIESLKALHNKPP